MLKLDESEKKDTHFSDLTHGDLCIVPYRISTLFKNCITDEIKSYFINPETYSTPQYFIPRL